MIVDVDFDVDDSIFDDLDSQQTPASDLRWLNNNVCKNDILKTDRVTATQPG